VGREWLAVDLKVRAIPLEVVELKAASSGGGWEFSAYASTFGNVDEGGDVMAKGAFDKTLAERDFRPLLWQHDMRQPIGVEKSIKVDDKGLLGTWTLLQKGMGEYAYECLKNGAVRAMSIGYIPEVVEYDFQDDNSPRILKQVNLLENSIVSLPMNEDALVQNVKALDVDALAKSIVGALAKASGKSFSLETLDPSTLTFSDLVRLVGLSADAFVESAKRLSATLAEGRPLTDSKRQELEALLGTFPGLDAVRSDVQRLLQTASAAPQQSDTVSGGEGKAATPSPATATATVSATGLSLEMRRRRLRAIGVEV
jgi:HK97 family phage prohead protease